MTPDNTIIRENLDQAVQILNEKDIDLWLTFVRETSLTHDPCLDLVAGVDMTWHSAFLVSRTGERIAIVGRYDAENIHATGGYGEIIGYDESLRPSLVNAVERINPRTIALNYSLSDPAADGLTHGMFLYLQETFAGTPFADRFVSAEGFVASLRGRKSPTEIERIRAAIRTTEQMYAELGATLAVGQTEREIAGRLTARRLELGLGTAWDEANCPIVNNGPDSPPGHTQPGDFKIARGQLVHMDFGVMQDGFCSDLQRMWYALDSGETEAPPDVRKAWDACWGAIDAGAAGLRPGVTGWQVDAAARAYLVEAGYPEYRHALGHGLGRVAHDGATLLGPRWDRYGQTPYGMVEAGNVFTLELGVAVPGRGYIGLEEDVLVTADGLEWLSTPQREIWYVR
ncbi:MAG TPA: Xaa-Pro peptidase family protein [Chloroflexia bacterium]|nr:Xaa-Pro peptidase family protein [Chloroflexia bacterium]